MQRTRSGFLKLAVTASVLLWTCIVATPAKADLVKYVFAGTVETIGSNLLGANSDLGAPGSENRGFFIPTPFSGFYILDPTVSPSSQISNVAHYSGTISQFHFTIQGNSTAQSLDYNSTTISPSHTIDVGHGAATPGAAHFLNLDDPANPVNPDPYPVDSYSAVISFSGNPVLGRGGPVTADRFEFNYIHNNTNHLDFPFGNTSLPVTPPGLNWHDTHAPLTIARVVFGTGDDASVVTVRLTDIHLVASPLPPAVILFGAGLVALIGLGAGSWRQKKNGLAVGSKN